MTALLECRSVGVSYGHAVALQDATLHVDAGEIVALVGANGAGKTTLLRTISGLVRPSAGTIRFAGADIAGLPVHAIVARGLSHIPEGRGVLGSLSVRDNLRIGAYLRGKPDDARMARIRAWFPLLFERLDQPAALLSGGEQQMLSISRALMARPRLMLLDEPSLGLSPKLVKDIFEIVVRINRERGVTILLVEQNANMALQTADYGYVLEVGRIVMADTCQRLMQKDDIKEFYLGIKDQGARGQRRWKKRKTWR